MVGIVARRPVDQLPAVRGTGFGAGQHHRSGRLAQVQAATLGVERPAGFRRKCLERLEARHDEARLHFGTGHHDVVVLTGKEHPPGVDQGAQARNAGIGDHQRRCILSEESGHVTGRYGDGDFGLIFAEFLDIALDGRNHESYPRRGGVDSGTADGVPDGKDQQSLEEIVAGYAFRGSVFRDLPAIEKRGAERLRDAERPFLRRDTAASFHDCTEIFLRGKSQRRKDIAGDCIHLLLHSAISLSVVAVFIEAVASSWSPLRTSMSVRVMPKISCRTYTDVSSVSPTAGWRRMRSFRTLPI